MMHLFLINPAAGKRDCTAALSAQINALCTARGLDYRIRVSKQPGDITAFTREAAQSGEETRVYACGGDGTLNEAVCGAAGAAHVALTHYPCGSGNDFIKNFEHPEAFRKLENLLDAREATLDLIQVGDRYSLSICSMGLDARIGTEIAKYKRLPLVNGTGAYTLSILANLIRGIHRHYVVEVGGERIDDRFSMICVCNGRFYGGGYEPVPEARPDDGRLEVLLVNRVTRLQVAGIIGKYKAGKWAEYPNLFRHYAANRVVIHCDREEVINLDGEAASGTDVEICLSEKKLRFFYPACTQLAEPKKD